MDPWQEKLNVLVLCNKERVSDAGLGLRANPALALYQAKQAAGVTKSDAFITDVHKATPVRVSQAAKPLAMKYDFFCIRRHIGSVAILHIVLLHNEPEIFISRDRIIDGPSALTPFP